MKKPTNLFLILIVVICIICPAAATEMIVAPPTGFAWAPQQQIVVDANGLYALDTDVSALQHIGEGVTYFVDIANGSNENDGLTLTSALRSIHAALNKPDVDIVWVASGVYPRNNGGTDGKNITHNVSIKALPGASVTVTTHDTLSWTLSAEKAYTYEAARSRVDSVYDVSNTDANGDYMPLLPVGSIAEVEATPNSYYFDTSMLYVHPFDGRAADADIRAYLAVKNIFVTPGCTCYVEGINFEGGIHGCLYGADNTTILAKDCSFKYAMGNGGVTIVGATLSIFQNCEAARNNADGFNYHIGTVIPKAIEVDCVGRNNGKDGNDNGSTAHDGSTVIRINGIYYGNYGPNVADVNADTQTWNINCTAYDSKESKGFQIKEGTAWYVDCEAHTNYDDDLAVSGGGSGYVRNSTFSVVYGTPIPY